MAFLEVHINPNRATNRTIPFLLDVQADLLSSLNTRLVVPLYRKDAAPARVIARLTPLLKFQGKTYVAMIPEIAGVSQRVLGTSAGHLTTLRAEIIAALDLLFTGI